jgi:hypothetical protein
MIMWFSSEQGGLKTIVMSYVSDHCRVILGEFAPFIFCVLWPRSTKPLFKDNSHFKTSLTFHEAGKAENDSLIDLPSHHVISSASMSIVVL